MIDYSKYGVIKTKKIVNNNTNVSYESAYKNQEDNVNYIIQDLLANGFEIIEITHDNVSMMTSNFGYIYTVTDITYGKLKNHKK